MGLSLRRGGATGISTDFSSPSIEMALLSSLVDTKPSLETIELVELKEVPLGILVGIRMGRSVKNSSSADSLLDIAGVRTDGQSDDLLVGDPLLGVWEEEVSDDRSDGRLLVLDSHRLSDMSRSSSSIDVCPVLSDESKDFFMARLGDKSEDRRCLLDPHRLSDA